MAIFANGPGTQTSTVGTATGTVPIFNTSATGLSAVNLRNVTVVNSGTAAAYIGVGTATTSVTGFPLTSGSQLLLQGPAVNLFACTASGNTTLVAGLSTQTVVD